MKKLALSKNDLSNLKELFKENYYAIKQVKDCEKKTLDRNIKTMLKELRNTHEDNLLTIMKLLDEKERIF